MINDFKEIAGRYHNSIRQKNRNQIRNKIRRMEQFGCPPAEQIARSLNLVPKVVGEYSIEELMLECEGELLNIDRPFEEKYQKNIKSQQNIVRLEGHQNFWAFLVEQLFMEKYTPNQTTWHFMQAYITHNKYKSITIDNLYEKKVINAMDLVAFHKNTPKSLLDGFLHWVGGTKSLSLIQNCVGNQYLDVRDFGNVYELLTLSIKSDNLSAVEEALRVIDRICKTADEDEIYQIYEYHPDLFISVLSKAAISLQNPTLMNLTCDVVLRLTDTYAEYVLNFVRMGVGQLICLLVASGNQLALGRGMEIFRTLSAVEGLELVQFWLGEEFQEQVWPVLRIQGPLYKHRNMSIRKDAYSIIANIMSNAHYEEVVGVAGLISTPENDVVALVSLTLEDEDEEEYIVVKTLSILRTLLFYSEQHRQPGQDNYFLQSVLGLGIKQYLQNYSKSMNENISSTCLQIIQNIQKIPLNSQ